MQGLVQLPKGGVKQLSPVFNESFPSNMCSLKMVTSKFREIKFQEQELEMSFAWKCFQAIACFDFGFLNAKSSDNNRL